MYEESYAGRFLVATPLISTPPFARSVVLLLEHDESGAIGVILNHDSGLPVEDVLPEAAALASDPANVFIGGPVGTDTAIALARAPRGSFLRPAALGTIGLVDPGAPPDNMTAMRLFAGYAGWDPGQLEGEIAEKAWWVTLADIESTLGDTSDLWRTAIRRSPGLTPLYSTYPRDPSTN